MHKLVVDRSRETAALGAQHQQQTPMPNPVKVVVRTRPTANFATGQLVVKPESNGIIVNTADPHETSHNKKSCFKFQYHQVLHNASQEATYHTMCSEVVLGAADGTNGTIMSYGQTGAGKTFTMIGDTRNFAHRGIAPRAIGELFAEVASRIETEYEVRASCMEIYNERIYDLLDGGEGAREEFQIVQDAKGGRGVMVRGLTERVVTSEAEALDALFEAELQRTTANHALNRRSNRSHGVFTLHISQRSRSGVSEKILHSKLHLIDLAGSERLKKTMEGPSGEQLDDVTKKESMCINRSLSYLEQCVVALSKKGGAQTHVPYRSSTLTHVLMDALGGNCRTLLFACIWGEAAQLEETVSTLRLAQRMMRVQNTADVNFELDPVAQVRKLGREVRELKQELKLHDALAGRSGVEYDEYTPDAQAQLQAVCRGFVDAPDASAGEELEVASMREVREMMRQMKRLVKAAEASVATVREDLMSRGASAAGGLGGTLDATAGFGGGVDDGAAVGDLQAGGGFGVGRAPDGARPPTQEVGKAGSPSRGGGSPSKSGRVGFSDTAGGGGATGGNGLGDDDVAAPLERNAAFEMYKSGAGRAAHEELSSVKATLKGARLRQKASSESVNDLKLEIDTLAAQLETKRRQRAVEQSGEDFGGEDVVDEEEFRLMRSERDTKRAYRSAFSSLRSSKQEMDALLSSVTSLKTTLVDSFETWHLSATGGDLPEPEPVFDEDKLDDGEAFEQMEMDRVVADDPDSLAFFQAHKKMNATKGANKSLLARKQHNKRYA